MNIKDFIEEAHKSADREIMKAKAKVKAKKIKDWLMMDIIIKRAYFAGVYICLFALIGYNVISY
jgi:hypothetical protein